MLSNSGDSWKLWKTSLEVSYNLKLYCKDNEERLREFFLYIQRQIFYWKFIIKKNMFFYWKFFLDRISIASSKSLK